jgi:hypothetical protein
MIPEHAESFYSRFERENIPLLLAGGWAVCHHGYARFTRDIDWVCSRAHEARACSLMQEMGFEKMTDGMASRFVLASSPGFPPVDLIWVDEGTFSQMGASDSMTGRHGDIPVITFRSLLAMKFYALKDDAVRQGRDMLDIRQLLGSVSHSMSKDDIRSLCEKYAGPSVFENEIERYL